MKVFVTGCTGLIGRRLVKTLLARGDSVLSLSRRVLPADHFGPGANEPIVGDPAVPGKWLNRLQECDAVVHLAGEAVAGKRWNAEYLARVKASRVDSTSLIAKTLAQGGRPKVLVNGSAVGYYGANTEDAEITESSPAGSDVLAEMCVAWESAADPARVSGVRVVHPRTGIVLDPEGGALPQMALPFKLFIGGKIGSGKQWLPWIHYADMTGLLLFMLDTPTLSGPVNAVALNPVTNAEFSRALSKVLKRPNLFPVPVFMLKLLLGGVAEVVAGGQKARPVKLGEVGFRWRFPEVAAALTDLLGKRPA